MEMPLLGIGSWKIGGTFERDMRMSDEELQSLRYALSVGYRLIDTAEIYGDGAAEEIVGTAIEEAEREELFIVSKVWNTHLHAKALDDALQGSLARLRTDYIDMYLIHWPNPDIPLTETLYAMQKQKDAGKIRHIGVSNFGVKELEEALSSGVSIECNQIEYSIVHREAEKEVIPFCHEHGIRVMAYRPLGKGNLYGAPESLHRIAIDRGASAPQIALSFITSQGITAIPKATKRSHLEENWHSQDFPLSKAQLAELKK